MSFKRTQTRGLALLFSLLALSLAPTSALSGNLDDLDDLWGSEDLIDPISDESERTLVNGGQRVRANEEIARSTVMLLSRNSTCTGTLIAEDMLVTAAHCMGAAEVVVFGLSVEEAVHATPVVAKGQHYLYGQGGDGFSDAYDIALVHFENGLPEGYKVATRLSDSVELKRGDKLLLAGFGVDNLNRESGILKKVELTLVTSKFGQTEIAFQQSSREGVCFGDSGGPAWYFIDGEPHLVGVLSRGGQDCGQFSIHADVRVYADWISNGMEVLRGIDVSQDEDES